MENTPILEIKNVSYRYEQETVLENISFTVPKGAFLGIVGPNGSGKSTLLKCILGLLRIQQGEIYLFGKKINDFQDWEKIGYVSQKANSFNTGFPATVFEVVRSGLTKKTGLFRFFPKNTKEIVIDALKAVEMESFIERNIGELSGGQQQRVFIARALVSKPELLILDEPTVGVDAVRVKAFYDLLSTLNKDHHITLILVTHDLDAITNQVTHIATFNRRLYFYGSPQDFLKLKKDEFFSFSERNLHFIPVNLEKKEKADD